MDVFSEFQEAQDEPSKNEDAGGGWDDNDEDWGSIEDTPQPVRFITFTILVL